MPTLLPDGTYEIKNSQGVVKRVRPEELAQYGLSVPTPQTPVTTSAPVVQPNQGILEKIGNFLAPTITGIAKDVGASSQTGDYVNQLQLSGDRETQLTKDYVIAKRAGNEAVASKIRAEIEQVKGGQPVMPGFSKETIKGVDTGESAGLNYATRGAKAGLEAGSYMVPFGKGTGILSKAVLPGAAVGAMSAAGAPDASVKSTLLGAAGGAAGGAALYGAGKLVKGALKKTPEWIMNGVFKEPMKDTKAAIKTGETLGEKILKDGGIKGVTDETILKNAVLAIEETENKLQQKLSGSTRIVPLSDIKAALKPLIKQYADAGNTSAVNSITSRIEALAEQHGTSIPVTVANEVKRTLYQEARNAYGTVASENMEGVKAIARALKEAIAKKVEGADGLNKILSLQGRIADSMTDKVARGGRNNILGLTKAIIAGAGLPGIVATGGMSMLPAIGMEVFGSTPGKIGTAKVLQGAGKIVNKAINPLTSTIAGQAAARAGAGGMNALLPSIGGEQGPEAATESNQQVNHAADTTTQTTPKSTLTGHSADEIARAMNRAFQANDFAAFDKLKTYYDMEVKNQSGGGKARSEFDKKMVFAGNEVQRALTLLTNNEKKIPVGPLSGFGRATAKFTGKQTPEATAFYSQLSLARTAVQSALLGASKSPQEVKDFLDANFNADLPLNVLKDNMASFINSINAYDTQISGAGTINDTSQLSTTTQ